MCLNKVFKVFLLCRRCGPGNVVAVMVITRHGEYYHGSTKHAQEVGKMIKFTGPLVYKILREQKKLRQLVDEHFNVATDLPLVVCKVVMDVRDLSDADAVECLWQVGKTNGTTQHAVIVSAIRNPKDRGSKGNSSGSQRSLFKEGGSRHFSIGIACACAF